MFAAFFIHIVLLHAQVGSGLPLMGSTQSSPAAPTVTNFRPIILEIGKPLVLSVGRPILIR